MDADQGSGMDKIRILDLGWKKVGSWIRDKHPGSATLLLGFLYFLHLIFRWHSEEETVFSWAGLPAPDYVSAYADPKQNWPTRETWRTHVRHTHTRYDGDIDGMWPGMVFTIVADPDPSDPYVFGPPGSGAGPSSQRYGSRSFYHQAKIVRKTLIPTVLWLLFDFLSLKNDVNVPSKSNRQKNFFK
jgi:hypothetical protein